MQLHEAANVKLVGEKITCLLQKPCLTIFPTKSLYIELTFPPWDAHSRDITGFSVEEIDFVRTEPVGFCLS